MANQTKPAVVLHADVVGSTALVHTDERLAHERIREAFRRLPGFVSRYGGWTREIRGEHRAAVAALEQALERATTDVLKAFLSLRLAFVLMQAGDETAARRAVQASRQLLPLTRVHRERTFQCQDPEHEERYLSQLARAGLAD